MTAPIKIELTAIQAKILFNIIDGAADAGACDDGLTKQEQRALEQISHKLLSRHGDWKHIKLQAG